MRVLCQIILALLAAFNANAFDEKEVFRFAFESLESVNQASQNRSCSEDKKDYVPSPLHESFSERGADCSKFIGEEGYGPYGLEIISKLEEMDQCSPMLSGDWGLTASCPRWRLFSMNQKKDFWVRVFAAIAWAESACLPSAKAPGVHGTALGLLQLNASLSNRSWRGPDCQAKDILDPKNNLRCGLDIMTELMKGSEGMYKSNGKLFGRRSNSYWEELRKKDGGLIGARIKTFKPCFEKESNSRF